MDKLYDVGRGHDVESPVFVYSHDAEEEKKFTRACQKRYKLIIINS